MREALNEPALFHSALMSSTDRPAETKISGQRHQAKLESFCLVLRS